MTTQNVESTTASEALIASDDRFAAHNYNPLPVVIERGSGAWVTDVDGVRYLDCLAGYSALNFGHNHPRLVAAAMEQLRRITLTSRAFHHDRLGGFCRSLAELTGMETILPMNTGAEAVETAIKIARKWAYEVKGVRDGRATIIVAAGNFHGRTTTIISFSQDENARRGFGPFAPGFVVVPFGDAEAITNAIDEDTAAVLIEPIQGESGVLIPPTGYLQHVRATCSRENVLFIADEIQSGLGRTGKTFACDHEAVQPDMYTLGKALGGGIMPVSAVATRTDIMDVIRPGTHGSTFGGNPLAAAIGSEVVAMLSDHTYQRKAAQLGAALAEGLEPLIGHGISAIRVRGLWAGIDIDPDVMTGRQFCLQMLRRGALVKDTHGSTVRLAPPLVISEEDLEWMMAQFREVVRAGAR